MAGIDPSLQRGGHVRIRHLQVVAVSLHLPGRNQGGRVDLDQHVGFAEGGTALAGGHAAAVRPIRIMPGIRACGLGAAGRQNHSQLAQACDG